MDTVSNKNLTFEDLYEVLREVHTDLKDEMDSGQHDAMSELVLAGQIIVMKYLAVRLDQRFKATEKASNEFSVALSKVTRKD